jgi:hypothetical protein
MICANFLLQIVNDCASGKIMTGWQLGFQVSYFRFKVQKLEFSAWHYLPADCADGRRFFCAVYKNPLRNQRNLRENFYPQIPLLKAE